MLCGFTCMLECRCRFDWRRLAWARACRRRWASTWWAAAPVRSAARDPWLAQRSSRTVSPWRRVPRTEIEGKRASPWTPWTRCRWTRVWFDSRWSSRSGEVWSTCWPTVWRESTRSDRWGRATGRSFWAFEWMCSTATSWAACTRSLLSACPCDCSRRPAWARWRPRRWRNAWMCSRTAVANWSPILSSFSHELRIDRSFRFQENNKIIFKWYSFVCEFFPVRYYRAERSTRRKRCDALEWTCKLMPWKRMRMRMRGGGAGRGGNCREWK